jgi:predicted oxidoreductase
MKVSQLKLSSDGPLCSRLALGLWRLADWRLEDGELLDLVLFSLDLGITTFDHADIYGDYRCEELFGQALSLNPGIRDRMQIVTKCGIKFPSKRRPEHRVHHYDTSSEHIVASVETSLRSFRTDRIDLLLIHRPDPIMDPDEIAAAFSVLKESGKVLHFGVSNFTPSQFDLLASRLDVPLVTNQIELSVLSLDVLHDGTMDHCQERRVSPMAWSPLGGGRLFQDQDERAIRLGRVLSSIGQNLGGAELAQVALAWILMHPAKIVPIVGSGRQDRIQEAAQAEHLSLSREQWFAIWIASTGGPVP